MRALHGCIRHAPPSNYRGIGREWLGWFLPASDSDLRAWLAADPRRAGETAARRRFAEIAGLSVHNPPAYEADRDDDLLPELAAAREVIALLPEPDQYDVLELRRAGFRGGSRLVGYDIGCWGGDHYSLIADSYVSPCWHPPPPSAIPDLAAALSRLNSNLLFPTQDAARTFLDWYRAQEWGETEATPGQFTVIEVLAVESL